jgi:HAE1 family hydrophobic/amphiphilic exporter-1
MGYSLDNVSLLGVTLAVGLVVDDSIVVLENIMRYVEQGMHPLKAALKGSKEVGFTIISISISLVAVFIPIFFMPGPIGLLFREFAVVVSLSILVSAVVSLTLVPMLCSKFLPKHGEEPKDYWITVKFDQLFHWVLRKYESSLDACLAHQRWVLAVAIGTFAVTIAMYIWVPKGFFPEEDIGQIQITTEASEDISFSAMLKLQDQAAEMVRNDPNVLSMVSFVGGGRQHRQLAQQRAYVRQPQAQERTRPDAKSVGRLAWQVSITAGHECLHASCSELAIGRQGQQEPLPVHFAKRGL